MVELDQQDLVLLNKDTVWSGEPGRAVPLHLKLMLLLSPLAMMIAAVTFAIASVDAFLRLIGRPLALLSEAANWLRSDYRLAILVVAFAGLSAALAWLARRQFLSDETLCDTAGCPDCAEHDFTRIRRTRLDRLIHLFRVPVRRYACRNCHWQGMRRYGGELTPASPPTVSEPTTLEWEGQEA